MSAQSLLRFHVRKKSVLSKKSENSPPKSIGVKRALFGEAQSPASPKKARIADENIPKSPSKDRVSPRKFPSLIEARQAFHTDFPGRLVGRSKEISDIHCFIRDHINNKTPGSLYISGAPGTGKTSSLMSVLKNFENKFSFAFVNCVSVSSPAAIYKTIAKELGLPPKVINSKNIADALKRHVSSSKSPIVLVLDEIDELDCKGQQVLYSLFEWPHLPQSTLILIGIANALDLTDRILPRLHTFQCQPKLMNFPPYTKDQIVSILEDRLSEVQSNGTSVIKPIAIQLCARKIAANTGDIRQALDVCRRAIQMVERKHSGSVALKSTSDDRCNPGSPMKSSATVQCVDLQDISAVLHEVYGSRLQASGAASNLETVTMPLHQKLILCTLVLMKRYCKLQDMNLGKAYDTYKRICLKRDIQGVGEDEYRGLCRLAECRCFLQLKPAKAVRLTKIVLKIEEGEVEHVMQDKALLPSILADRSVLSK